jgi:type IV secretion system protein VirB5
MKKLLCVFIICFLNSLNCLAAITVVHDPKNNLQIINQLRQAKKYWEEQKRQFKEQNNMMKDQLASNTGMRDVGDLDNELSDLKKELKGIEKHRDLLNNLLRSPDPEQNNEANRILEKYHMFDICREKGNGKLDNICKEEILNKAGTMEAGEDIRKQIERKMGEASKLAKKAEKTKDIKESQDVSNAIALKDMEINQLKNQWDSFVDESNLREKLIEEKRYKAYIEHEINAPLPTLNL